MKSDLVLVSSVSRIPSARMVQEGMHQHTLENRVRHHASATRESEKPASNAHNSTERADAEELIRQLIQQSTKHSSTCGGSQGSGAVGVVLDLLVDGHRCVLVHRQPQASARPQALLSPRERQIVQLAAMGHPNKIIAHMLKISTWTVNTHLRHIFAKLDVCSRTAMVTKVLEADRMDWPREYSASASNAG